MVVRVAQGHVLDGGEPATGELLRRWYSEEQQTARQIASHTGISEQTIGRWLRRFGIALRSRRERALRAYRAPERKRTATVPLKPVVRCRACGWVWKRQAQQCLEPCPHCGAPTNCRDRSGQHRGNPEGKADRLREANRSRTDESKRRLRRSVLVLVGKGVIRCVYCGCDRPDLLEVNHRNGGGAQEMKRGGRHPSDFYWRIVRLERSTDDLEVTCKVCNARHYLELKHGPLPFRVVWGEGGEG